MSDPFAVNPPQISAQQPVRLVIKSPLIESLPTYPDSRLYRFTGCGAFNVGWLAGCCLLFKEQYLVIRKLIVQEDYRSPNPQYRHIGIEFIIPQSVNAKKIITQLTHKLKEIQWIELS